MPQIPFAVQCSIPEDQLLPLKDSVNGYLFSASVTNIPEFEYYLRIYPNGDNDERRGKTCIVLIVKFKNIKKVEADYTFTFESANLFHPFHHIFEKSSGWGTNICETEEFFDAEKKFIADGKFTIKINGLFKYETGNDVIPAAIGDGQQNWIGGELGDATWAKDDTKDFTIATADEREVKVHKFILGVRSEVFTAMFNSNMKETTENKVSITDFSFNVVETGIKLIYDCNFCTTLSIDELMQLLQFFDKYQLLSLKAKIEPFLIVQISASTVVRLTNGSILTNSQKLKEKCMEFLSAAFAAKTPLTDFDDLDNLLFFRLLKTLFINILILLKMYPIFFCFYQRKMPQIPFSIQWPIAENQLLPLKDSIDGKLFSDRVSNIPEFYYYLKISPNGHIDQCRGKTWIFLHLELKNVKKVEADFTFTIESANFSKSIHYVFEKSYGWGPYICPTEEFFDPEKKFIFDGKFTVKVNGIFKFETEIPTAIKEEQQKWIGGELGEKSWKNDDTKDFTINTADSGKEIKVHKFILGIQSEVFTAMFKSNMKESIENKVNITDFSFKVVETGIKLIYECNFTSSLSLGELMELLQFFDKYQLLSLRAKVESLLVHKISSSTVVRLTNGSILTNSFKLKEKCMEFLSVAFKSQIPLADFKDIDKEIAFEVLENSFYKVLEIKK